MTTHANIIEAAAAYVSELLQSQLDPIYVYHNLAHTKDVVNAAIEIGKGNNLSAEDLEDVTLAAWFHDAGYTGGFSDHESRSNEQVEAFLTEQNHPADRIDRIKAAILDTRFPGRPESLLGKVLSDADMHHLGKESYFDTSGQLRQEWETANNRTFTDLEWCRMGIDFMGKQQFSTPYAESTFGPQKAANLKKTEQMVKDLEKQADSSGSEKPGLTPEEAEEKKRKKKKRKQKKLLEIAMAMTKAKFQVKSAEKEARPERGIETMFRVALKNHMQLSQLADSKANIMLSINAIIISIVLSALLPRVDHNQYLLFPMLVLLVVCIVSMGFATISTIPKVTQGSATRDDIINKKANLLFFGNFHKMLLPDFEWGIARLMEDRDYLYGSMTKDLYFLGRVLHKKYHYLRITYLVFMVGLVLAVLAFVVAYWLEFGGTTVVAPVAL